MSCINVIILSSLIFLFGLRVSASEKTITAFHYPPFMSTEKIPGIGNGIGVDIVNEVYRRVGEKVQFQFYPMRRSIYLVENGAAKIYLGTINHLEHSEVRNDFVSVDLFPLTFVFYYFKKDKNLEFDSSDIKNFSVGSVRGSATKSHLYNMGIKNIVWSSSIENNLNMFLNNRFDFCISEEYTADIFFRLSKIKGKAEISKIEEPLMKIYMNLNP